MLGYKRNGPRTKHLITITNNSILSLFFYSSPIINKFSETHLKSCNVIQTTSLRIALGVPIWTPNVILLKLAGQEILSEKIKRLAIQFFIKQIATQPFSALFHTPDRIYSHLVEKDAESLRITFRNLSCIPDHIISLPIFPHSSSNVCEIFLKDIYFQNKELPSSIISSDFIECIQRFFPNHFIISTDASKSHCYTSIAGFSCLQQFCYRIHPLNSVFTAEVLAICQALDELVVPEKDILILSDSFSALSFLKNISFHSPKVIQRLAAKIHIRKNLNQNIAFLWIPGHSGVSWNEKADSIAKQVSDLSPYIDWIASEDIFSHLKKQLLQITEENYHKSNYQLLIGNIPDILTISKWTGNRVQDRLIARIISKTITTPGLLSRFNLHPDPLCRISIIKIGRHLSFRVDDKKKPLTLKVRRRLTLRSPLYVGGVPEEMEAIHKVVMESFKGCIRNFHLNGKYLDIASGELQNVGHCFQTIEPGAYFSGDAYAIYANDFDLGIRLDIQMEFKTTRQNGLLLALSEGYGVPSIALEIDNGSIIISVLLGNEEKPFSAVRTFESSYYVCDGQWHMVTAQYAHKSVTLKVDLFDVTVGMSHTVPLEPNTASPLYIGGIPDDVPSGAAHNRNNFIGCLRNIAINDRRVEWIDMAARHNVLSNACPTF
ncbi:Laminin subunit alpha-1 [Araneus ventricosus]|uniref:Laminin subunit alpha-1 n=1 Tax=Araneus ventricosus TaxID=182803 RepID=A0A4Y2DID4_ARAVE|nr:Laminin subunit alpha-1 [Araneus ventricosus]